MSKIIRKKLFSMLETLDEATTIIGDLALDADKSESINLLADCQDCAIAIGEQIDKIYAGASESIKALEEYCEQIYELSQTEESDDHKQMKDCNALQKQISIIRECMEEEIDDRLEVVFLPYNVAMWDSLESIWKAAKSDAKCETYVIPIPYYDKNPDGSLGQEHYDGNCYPDSVPVTDYREYDFALRQPDIVFIHNPYDGGNKVTSVHPFFYSKNLKQYTQMLVYVPYFVLDGNWIGDNLILTSGVVHADYIIVKNETEKTYYNNCFKMHYPELPMENKFLPLGSPKLDKVRGFCEEDVRIPDEWKEKAKNKSVILYNTGIALFLWKTEQFLTKLENVFRYFEEREDVVLLWRPHPLLDVTVASKGQEVTERYSAIKNFFLKENVGIYDDSTDMYPAIAFSDMYYGDYSSLVQLYRETGKKVQIQNVEVPDECVYYNQESYQKRTEPNRESSGQTDGGKIYETIRAKYNSMLCECEA